MSSTDKSGVTVTYSYDSFGGQKTVNDAVGSRAFSYNNALQFETETITRQYDALGRSAGFESGDDCSVTYGYDATGRLINGNSLAPLYLWKFCLH